MQRCKQQLIFLQCQKLDSIRNGNLYNYYKFLWPRAPCRDQGVKGLSLKDQGPRSKAPQGSRPQGPGTILSQIWVNISQASSWLLRKLQRTRGPFPGNQDYHIRHTKDQTPGKLPTHTVQQQRADEGRPGEHTGNRVQEKWAAEASAGTSTCNYRGKGGWRWLALWAQVPLELPCFFGTSTLKASTGLLVPIFLFVAVSTLDTMQRRSRQRVR